MATTVTLPDDLAYDLDLRVNAGEFASREEAVAYFIRKGIERAREGRDRSPPPPYPQPRDLPPGEKPIQVDPTDVNWAPE